MLCFGPCVQRPLRAPVTGLRAALLGCCSYSPSPASAGIPSSWRTPGLQLYIPGAVDEPSRHTHSLTTNTARYSAGVELSGGWSTINVLIAANKEINNERGERPEKHLFPRLLPLQTLQSDPRALFRGRFYSVKHTHSARAYFKGERKQLQLQQNVLQWTIFKATVSFWQAPKIFLQQDICM